jgi:hypothetical protein
MLNSSKQSLTSSCAYWIWDTELGVCLWSICCQFICLWDFFFQDEHAGSKSNSQKRIRGDYIGYVKEMMVRQQRDVSGANTCTRERKWGPNEGQWDAKGRKGSGERPGERLSEITYPFCLVDARCGSFIHLSKQFWKDCYSQLLPTC